MALYGLKSLWIDQVMAARYMCVDKSTVQDSGCRCFHCSMLVGDLSFRQKIGVEIASRCRRICVVVNDEYIRNRGVASKLIEETM